jgi:hypothetical protein
VAQYIEGGAKSHLSVYMKEIKENHCQRIKIFLPEIIKNSYSYWLILILTIYYLEIVWRKAAHTTRSDVLIDVSRDSRDMYVFLTPLPFHVNRRR